MLENIFCFTLGLVTPGIATTVLVKEVLKAKREESVRNRELKEENEALKKKNDELVDEIVNELERNGELCNIIREESARNRELKEEMELTSVLKQKRLALNMSQKRFAETCGMSQQHYAFIEAGTRRPSPEKAKK